MESVKGRQQHTIYINIKINERPVHFVNAHNLLGCLNENFDLDFVKT
jgi:hypothetical protein